MTLQTPHSAPPATARDPVCGMPVDPATAAARRTADDVTYFFCSERCVQQFDREHAPSATTGVADTGGQRRIELPISEVGGHRETSRLHERLRAVAGVRDASINATSKLARVDYDPATTTVKTIVDTIRDRKSVV